MNDSKIDNSQESDESIGLLKKRQRIQRTQKAKPKKKASKAKKPLNPPELPKPQKARAPRGKGIYTLEKKTLHREDLTAQGTLTEEALQAIDKCAHRICGPKDTEYFKHWLSELVLNHAIPSVLLEHIPEKAAKVGKTRFDQLYDASMALVFPEYRKETIERLLGTKELSHEKIWRIMLPEKFRMAHVLIRAQSMQEAYALGCDYACRASLRMFGCLPMDLTIRVAFVSERSIRRMLCMRWANKNKKRQELKLVGRVFTDRQINGARITALGHPSDKYYSIVRYTERRDLDKILASRGIVRLSSVEYDSPKKIQNFED